MATQPAQTEPSPYLSHPSTPSLRENSPEIAGVLEQCQQKLAHSPYIALRQLVCHFHEGMLTIRGTVPTFHTKQMAYVAIRDVPGIERFVDRIEVVDRATTADV